MLKKITLIFITLWSTTVTSTMAPTDTLSITQRNLDAPGNACYFDTNFLKQYNQVADKLVKDENFRRITFKTGDGYILEGLYRQVPHARCTIIVCAGFYPGRQEGMASIVPLLPEDYNILFFNPLLREPF